MQQLQIPHFPQTNFVDDLLKQIGHVEDPDEYDFDDFDTRPVGAGYFSTVWAIPGEPLKVLKVSHRPDDACRGYMEWCYTNPHANAPKIESIEYRDDLMLVVMERYYPTAFIDNSQTPGRQILHGLQTPEPGNGVDELAFQIRETFHHARFDLHCANVMQNSRGDYIITDPVSWVDYDE